MADHLYRNHPDLPEGELTRTRSALVCEESLVEVAQALGLGEYLKLGKGEEAGGGRHRPSIQADAVEAVLAAVYLDGGIGSARKIIQKFILSREVAGLTKPRDYKTCLLYTSVQRRGPLMGTAGAQRPKGTRRGGFQPPEKPSPSWGEGVAAYAATDERAVLRPPLAAGRNPQNTSSPPSGRAGGSRGGELWNQ